LQGKKLKNHDLKKESPEAMDLIWAFLREGTARIHRGKQGHFDPAFLRVEQFNQNVSPRSFLFTEGYR